MTTGNWIFMIIEIVLIPAVMIGFGRSFSKKSPSNRNNAFAYRSKRSQINQETWDFAHRYIGKLWFRLGIATAIVTAVVVLTVIGKSTQQIRLVIGSLILFHLIPLILSMLITEHALNKNFDDEGNRRT